MKGHLIEIERIGSEAGDPGAWICICGNRPCEGGFYPCDEQGNEMEPSIGSDWASLYCCTDCGRIIVHPTLVVCGRATNPILL